MPATVDFDELIDTCLAKIEELDGQLPLDAPKVDAEIYLQHATLSKIYDELIRLKNQCYQVTKDMGNDGYANSVKQGFIDDIKIELTSSYMEALVDDATVVNGKPSTRKNALATMIEAIILSAGSDKKSNPNLPANFDPKKNFESQFLGNIESVYFIKQVMFMAGSNYSAALVETKQNIKDLDSAKCAKALHIASQLSPTGIAVFNRELTTEPLPENFKINSYPKTKLTVVNLFNQITNWVKQKIWGNMTPEFTKYAKEIHAEVLKTSYPVNATPSSVSSEETHLVRNSFLNDRRKILKRKGSEVPEEVQPPKKKIK